MGAVCTSAPLTAWQCLVCADASQGGLLCLREWAQAQRRMEWGSAAVGCEAGPVAAESLEHVGNGEKAHGGLGCGEQA